MSSSSHNVAASLLAAGAPDAVAVVAGAESLSYAELRAQVAALCRGLAAHGCRPGDRVGLLAENGPRFVAAYLAIIHSGCCAVPLPVDIAAETLAALAASIGFRCLAASPRCRARLAADRPEIIDLGAAAAPHAQTALPPPCEVDPGRHLAAIMLTSGSTGAPKGVMVSHRNIECNTLDILQYTGISAADRAMVVLPFYYCFGLSLLHTHLWAGGTVVLNNRFMFPEKVLDDLAAQRCTGMAGVPSTFQILLRKTHFAARRFPALRWLQQAGGRLPNVFIRQLREAHPQVRLFIMYGQTEATARLSYLPPERLDDKLGSIGRGLPSGRLAVLRDDGAPVAPGTEEVGEIVASGDNITLGYWNDPEETARYFRAGQLHTGDMARVDRDGFIFVVERARDFIKSMGNRVSAKEVEEVLCELPGVVEAAVVGVADELWGEAIKAFLVTTNRVPPEQDARRSPGGAAGNAAEPLTADAIRAHCLTRLPNYKIPQFIEFLPELPRTNHGKVDKPKLRARAEAERREQPSVKAECEHERAE